MAAKKKAMSKKSVKKIKEAVKVAKAELVDLSVEDVKNGVQKRLFEGAPKACFGRQYSAAVNSACEGRPGMSAACEHKDGCRGLMMARLTAGVAAPTDFRIPKDYDVAQWTKKPEPVEKSKKKAKGKKASGKEKVGEKPAEIGAVTEAAPPVVEEKTTEMPPAAVEETVEKPAEVVTPAPEDNAPTVVDKTELLPAAETTITKEELDDAEAALDAIEQAHLSGRVAYYLARGRTFRGVYQKMCASEFSAWLGRIDVTRRIVDRDMKLAVVVDTHGADFEKVLLEAPKLTLQKFDVLLEIVGPEQLATALVYKAADGHGTMRLLTALPVSDMKKAAKTFVHVDDAKDKIDGLVEKAEANDAARRAGGANVTATVIDKTTGEVTSVPAALDPLTPETVKPFYPMPYLLPLHKLEKLWAANRGKIATGNLAALTAKDRVMLKAYLIFVRDVLVPDMSEIEALLDS